MKYFIIFFCVILSYHTHAQIEAPPLSSHGILEQTIGFSNVRIEYHRPNVKGRKIFGELIPFDDYWRTGANSATRFSLYGDIQVKDSILPKGEYVILSTPNTKSWKFHFYKHDSDDWTTYPDKKPILTIAVQPEILEVPVETMEWRFIGVTINSATLSLTWENLHLPLPIKSNIHDRVMESIQNMLPKATADDYYDAAVYLHEVKRDLDKALEYIELATEGDDPGFWRVRLKALILADLGRYQAAIDVAQQSKELAIIADNFFTNYYLRINDISIKEWRSKN